MVTVFLRRPSNLETNSISYSRCTFTGPADQVEKAKEAFQFQIDLVRAGKSTTTPTFYKWFQDMILDMDLLGSKIHEDEEKRKKNREDIMEAFAMDIMDIMEAFFRIWKSYIIQQK